MTFEDRFEKAIKNGEPCEVVRFDKNWDFTIAEQYNMENFKPPRYALESFARAILPAIQEFYSNEEGQRLYDEHCIKNGEPPKYKGLNMTITEVKQDLFTVPADYYLAHCISGDYALGAGIAKSFNEKMNMRSKLFEIYPIAANEKSRGVGKALLVDNVFNLVTKERYYQKPTYKSLKSTLVDMKNQCQTLNIKKIAMPLIACGLDRLEWPKVKATIEDVFGYIEIDILICSL